MTIALDEPFSASQSMEIVFWSYGIKSTAVDAIIEGSMRPSGEYVAFHVVGRSGSRDHGVRLGVVAYWIICGDLKLEDIGRLRFSEPCIDSFCPMTNVQIKDEYNSFSIAATTCLENVIDLGLSTVDDKELRLSAETYWVYDYCRQINFVSCLDCEVDSLNYGLMKDAYVNIAAAVRFCLRRIVLRLSERVEEDNLETRIRHTCKTLPKAVADAVFENTGINRKYTQLGKKITTMRNDIAHENKLQYNLSAICEEYQLPDNLVFAMRLMLISIPSEDAVRLLKCAG